MTPNEPLMEQCRREAQERYRMSVYAEHRFVQTTDVALATAIAEAKREAYAAALYAERSKPRTLLSVDELAQQIRIVDGSNNLGAGALAEALMPFLTAKLNEHIP